ncbi:ABC transporter substrate-binding protein [Candidatus Bipolaricaulota bacterium]|nr:ABC transporter substrate-binding protein [Candidatus Bipolaricaulota bacterium]
MTKRIHWVMALVLAVVLVTTAFAGCSPASSDKGDEVIRFADCGWDTDTFMVYVAAFIVEHGYGYDVVIESTSNIVGLKAIETGDIDVHMEVAPVSLQEPYEALLATGLGEQIGVGYGPQVQSWFVPTFVIEGDAERGIEPMAPDLKSVFDLPEYWELFKDAEDPDKGRFYGCIPGWQCEKTNNDKIVGYGLDEYYNVFTPGSDTALATSMIAAFEKGEPWFGYYWSPTWVLAKVDMTMLEEPEWSKELWTEEAKYACAYPDENPIIVGAVDLKERAPDVHEFMGEFNVPVEVHNTMLLYLQESGKLSSEITEWFLIRYEDVWTEWVSDEVAANVKAAL